MRYLLKAKHLVSEDNIGIVILLFSVIEVFEDVFVGLGLWVDIAGSLLLGVSGGNFGFFFLLGLFLFVLDALKSIEILSIQLIELTFNPLDSPIDLWDDDELKGIYSSGRDLDDSLDGDVLSLVGSNLDEELQVSSEGLLGLHDGLTTTSQTDHGVVIILVQALDHEGWLLDTCNVLLSDEESHGGLGLDGITDGHTEVTGGEVSLSHIELALVIVTTHSLLSGDDHLGDVIEFFLQGIGLFLEKIITFLGSNLLLLEGLEGPEMQMAR